MVELFRSQGALSEDDDDMPYAAPSREDTGGFRLNYDDNAPLGPIDCGGPDQEQR